MGAKMTSKVQSNEQMLVASTSTGSSQKIATRPDMKLESAIFAVRRGSPVLIRDVKGNCALVQAAEFADYPNPQLNNMPVSGTVLCLTQQHMRTWHRPYLTDRPTYSLPTQSLSPEQIIALVLGDDSSIDRSISILPEREGSLPALANQLLKSSKLLPAALLTRVLIDEEADLLRLADTYHIPVVAERDLHRYEAQKQDLEMGVNVRLPLAAAPDARMIMFRAPWQREEHFAIIVGDGLKVANPLVRVHSQCLTGDILGSLKCDCGPQLHTALHTMQDAGAGILIYLAQEGRDIGLLNKMRTYALQDTGLDTVEANHRLGFETDQRVFTPAAQMLKALGQTDIKLMTNNPDKMDQLGQHGISVVERVPLILPTNPHNHDYMQTKKDRTGHFLD